MRVVIENITEDLYLLMKILEKLEFSNNGEVAEILK